MTKRPTLLPNDYERMIPEYHKGEQVYGEHIARYKALGDITKDKIVLDIASGSGYGTALIAKTARQVSGVDVSAEAVAYAQENYDGQNIEYKKGDGVKIPYPDGYFEIITSFETIEHIKDYKSFMSECKRVLKKDGLLLLSTPNSIEFAEGNHFHLHEFEQYELLNLVKKYYKYIKPYYQTTWVSNLVGDEKMMTHEQQSKISFLQAAPVKKEKFLYFYFLCSDRPIDESIDNLMVLGEHYSERVLSIKREENIKIILAYQEKLKVDAKYYKAQVYEYKRKFEKVNQELTDIKRSKTYRVGGHIAKVKKGLKLKTLHSKSRKK